MKKIYLLLFILSALYISVDAQLSFIRNDSIPVTDQAVPLKLPWAGGLDYPMFNEIDLNGDGIMDLIVYDPGNGYGDCPGHSHLMPFLNYGTHGQVDYHYAPEYISHFPDVYAWMVTYDYNCDGKMDLFMLSKSCSCGIMVYRNDFDSISGLKFTLVADPINTQYSGVGKYNITANAISVPAFADVDNDGDMDIINFPAAPNGTFEYERNLAADSGWSCDSLSFINASQCWGSFALATCSQAEFGITCRMMAPDSSLYWDKGITIVDDGTVSDILLYDNDGDGLKDCLIGTYQCNNALFLHNAGSHGKDSMDYAIDSFPNYDVPIDLQTFPSFFYLDVNNDSLKDLIVTPHSVSNFSGILYYKNIGTRSHPVFQKQPGTLLQQDMIDVGSNAAPALFDYNGDGLPDLVIGNQNYSDTSGIVHYGLTLYQNTGTASAPAFQLVTRDYLGLDTIPGAGTPYLHPTFGDLNGDGAVDMMLGTSVGKLLYFVNTAPAHSPVNFVLPSTSFDSIDVGSNSAPQLYDLNHDGLLDLIIGNSYGVIKYYQNIGSPTAPTFLSTPSIDNLGGINTCSPGYVSGYASPFFYNDNGVDKLIVGAENGKVYVYDNINGNFNGTYHLADSLVNGEEGGNLIPFIGDINNDGHPDMLVGNATGGVALYMNSLTVTGINEVHGTVAPDFTVYPNPASNQLTIHTTAIRTSETVTISIMNLLGQVLKEEKINWSRDENINIKNIAAGIYFIQLKTGSGSVVKKFVKE